MTTNDTTPTTPAISDAAVRAAMLAAAQTLYSGKHDDLPGSDIAPLAMRAALAAALPHIAPAPVESFNEDDPFIIPDDSRVVMRSDNRVANSCCQGNEPDCIGCDPLPPAPHIVREMSLACPPNRLMTSHGGLTTMTRTQRRICHRTGLTSLLATGTAISGFCRWTK